MQEEKTLTDLIELQRENIRITHENNNSLRKENAELRDIIERQKQTIIQYNEKDAKQKAEIERLTEDCESADAVLEAQSYLIDLMKKAQDKLQKQVYELTDKLGNVLSTVGIDEYQQSKAIEQAVKDTVKEILDGLIERKERVKSFYGIAESVGVDIAIRAVKEILKQKGVEVE